LRPKLVPSLKLIYRINLRRITPAIDSRPVPTSNSDCGSGTSTAEAQWLEKMQPAAVVLPKVQVLRRGAGVLSIAISPGTLLAGIVTPRLATCFAF
jgi:hypothetical protein